MAVELRDFRAKITDETYLALEAEALAFARDKADVAREVLHVWAMRKIHGAKILNRLVQSNGISGAGEGREGSPK